MSRLAALLVAGSLLSASALAASDDLATDLDKLIDRAERNHAADPAFLNDLRDLTWKHLFLRRQGTRRSGAATPDPTSRTHACGSTQLHQRIGRADAAIRSWWLRGLYLLEFRPIK